MKLIKPFTLPLLSSGTESEMKAIIEVIVNRNEIPKSIIEIITIVKFPKMNRIVDKPKVIDPRAKGNFLPIISTNLPIGIEAITIVNKRGIKVNHQ